MGNQPKVTASITAQNTFTDGIGVHGESSAYITGTFVATVTLQKTRDQGVTWEDAYDKNGNVYEWTAPAEFIIKEPSNFIQYRLGVKTGAYTSGTANVGIIQ